MMGSYTSDGRGQVDHGHQYNLYEDVHIVTPCIIPLRILASDKSTHTHI